MKKLKSETVKLKAKRTFLKKGTCSRTFFYLLDREFGHPMDAEEKAIDPMAGGILQQGYQCGMLWGASMAVSAETLRRNEDPERATGIAILATQHLMRSFVDRTNSIECEDITQTDFQNKRSFAKYMLSGRFVGCFILAGKWAPEALNASLEGLELDQTDLPQKSMSCASEVVRKMGGSEESEAYKSFDPDKNQTLLAFYEETDYEMQCDKICGQSFETLDEHTEFVKNGGCKKLIKVLADTTEQRK